MLLYTSGCTLALLLILYSGKVLVLQWTRDIMPGTSKLLHYADDMPVCRYIPYPLPYRHYCCGLARLPPRRCRTPLRAAGVYPCALPLAVALAFGSHARSTVCPSTCAAAEP